MKAKVIGYRAVNGINQKTGRYRDGCILYIAYNVDGMVGQEADSFWMNSSLCLPENIEVGGSYEVGNKDGFVISFEAEQEA